MNTQLFFNSLDPQGILWRNAKDRNACISMGTKLYHNPLNDMLADIQEKIRTRFVLLELNQPQQSICHNKFMSTKVYYCRQLACSFKIQVSILCKITTESDEDLEKIKDIVRFLCHLSYRNDHSTYPGRSFNAHPFGKIIKEIQLNHNVYRLNIKVEQWDPPKVNGLRTAPYRDSLNPEEVTYGKKSVPEIYLYYLKYKKGKHVETAKHWQQELRSGLTHLQIEYKTHGENCLLEEAKELVKPLTEFRQYAHPEKPYEKASYDFDETIEITTSDLPKQHGFESDEVTFKVKRHQEALKLMIYDQNFKVFAQFVGELPYQRIQPWLSNSMSQYNSQFLGGERYIRDEAKTWEKDICSKIHKILGTTPDDLLAQDENNAQLQVKLLDNMLLADGDRDLIYKAFDEQIVAEDDDIQQYQRNYNEENSKLQTLQDNVNRMKVTLNEKKDRAILTATQAEQFRSADQELITPFEQQIFLRLNSITADAKKVYLAGGGSSLQGFADFFKRQLRLNFPLIDKKPIAVLRNVPTYSDKMKKKKEDAVDSNMQSFVMNAEDQKLSEDEIVKAIITNSSPQEMNKWLIKAESKLGPEFKSQDFTHDESDDEKLEKKIVELKQEQASQIAKEIRSTVQLAKVQIKAAKAEEITKQLKSRDRRNKIFQQQQVNRLANQKKQELKKQLKLKQKGQLGKSINLRAEMF